MGYRKSIKGDSNQQSEEFSHNRVSIHFDGAGIVLFVVFLIALITSALIWLVVHFGGLLLLCLLALCLVTLVGGVWLLGVYVYTRSGILLSERRRARNHERLIEAGEVSFYLMPLNPDYTIYGSSVEHNRALIAPPPQVMVTEEATTSDDEILLLWNKGMSLRDIEKLTTAKYNRIQKVTAAAKDKFKRESEQ